MSRALPMGVGWTGSVGVMADQPTIVVRGEALREVPPEQAVLSVTTSARDRDRDAVLARLTERAAELRAVVDAYGAAIERLETGTLQVYPELKRGSEKVVAYTGSVVTTVTVTDFAGLGRRPSASRKTPRRRSRSIRSRRPSRPR